MQAVLVAALAVSLGACHTRKSVTGASGAAVSRPGTPAVVRPMQPPVTGSTADSNDAALVARLIDGAYGWIGTPYRYGGTDRSGADCSGFLQRLFADIAAVSLPRNSRKQAEYCRPVARELLQPGDLVFFNGSRIGGDIGHVGLYVGDERMIHASSSRGVIVSSMAEKYYTQRYCGGGRVAAITYAARGGMPEPVPAELPRAAEAAPLIVAVAPEPEPVAATEPEPATATATVRADAAMPADEEPPRVVQSEISALVDSAFAAAARVAAAEAEGKAEADTVCVSWMD